MTPTLARLSLNCLLECGHVGFWLQVGQRTSVLMRRSDQPFHTTTTSLLSVMPTL